MKMYKILRIPDELREALDDNNPEATTIKEVRVVRVEGDKVLVPYPIDNPVGVMAQHRREGWYDTEAEAREAIMTYIYGRIQELTAQVAYCWHAVGRMVPRTYYRKQEG